MLPPIYPEYELDRWTTDFLFIFSMKPPGSTWNLGLLAESMVHATETKIFLFIIGSFESAVSFMNTEFRYLKWPTLHKAHYTVNRG